MSIRSRGLIVLLGQFYSNWVFCQLCLPITEEEMLKYTIKMVFLSMSPFNSIFISAFRYSLLVCRCLRFSWRICSFIVTLSFLISDNYISKFWYRNHVVTPTFGLLVLWYSSLHPFTFNLSNLYI